MAASRDGFTCPTASYAMTDITLVRYAESIWHAEDRYCGVTDVDLTEEGRRQTQLLARWDASANLSAVWTSPLQRCQLTADPCAAGIGQKPFVNARLRELVFGSLEGKTKFRQGVRSRAKEQPVERRYRTARSIASTAHRYLGSGRLPARAIQTSRIGLD
jgi:broad specificity phosphatase PhoE